MQDKQFTKQIGSRIKETREAKGRTQSSLAISCGVEEKHIQAIEGGRRRPSYELICKISEELNTTVDFFLRDSRHISTSYIIQAYAERIEKMSTRTRQTGLEMMETLLKLQINQEEDLKRDNRLE